MPIIIAIDPGPETSAIVTMDHDGIWHSEGIQDNKDMCDVLIAECAPNSTIVCESIESYGMPVGKSIFETCYWIGEFRHVAGRMLDDYGIEVGFVLWPRREVKLQLCGNSRAKDPNIRRALLDRFPATGGGKTPQVGTKAHPGPLYGFKSHLWSALAVGVSWSEVQMQRGAA